MRSLVLLLVLPVLAVAGPRHSPPQRQAPSAGGGPEIKSEPEVQRWFVDRVLDTPLYRMTWAQADYFVRKVNPDLLASEQRSAYFARKKAVIKAGLHKKPEPPKRSLPQKTKRRKKVKAKIDMNDPEALLKAGYKEIEHKEYRWLKEETKCSEDQLLEFSTLRIVPGISKKGEKAVRYFLQEKDPLFAAVANFRKGHKKIGGTRTFGSKTHSYCQ